MRLAIALPSLLLLAACGGSPTRPAAYPPVAGNYTGTIQTNNFGTQAIQIQVSQNQEVVTGQWTSDAGWSGTLVGRVETTGSMTAAMSIVAANAAGVGCAGTATVGGGFTTALLSLGSPGFSGQCSALPQDLTILTRRQ
jgi:hypothetical protein